jgi:quercetin dioxygenase-like cupin family protein
MLGAAMTVIAFVASSEIDSFLDPVKVSPQYYKVLLENDQVRVLEYRLKPGEKESLHSHPSGVVYSFNDGKLKGSLKGSESRESTAKAGQVMWRDPITHSIENIGSTELHALAVEFKKTCK